MNGNGEALQRPHVRKRFYFLSLMVFLPVFFCLAVMQARWYGYLAAMAAFGLLIWVRHALAWRGWHAPLCFTLALAVAFTGLYFSRPRWDASLAGQIGAGVVRVFVRLPVDQSVKSGETFGETSVYKPSEGFRWEVVTLPNCTMEALTRTDGGNGYAVLQLHGGAFAAGMNDMYRLMAEKYSELAGGAAVYTVDYRLYPRYPYPSQQNDAMDAWAYLTGALGYAADHIFLAGDSAGGNLVLYVGLRLRDEGAAMPAGLVAMSPWADLSNAGASHYENATADPSFGVPESEYDGVSAVGVNSDYAEGLNAKSPYLSPSYGDYTGFPPMLLQAGSIEVLLSDSEAVRDNAASHGVDCTLTVYPGMFHVFQGSLELLPESREAWAEVGRFLTRLIGDQPAR